jgi:hypothetical protein
MTMNATPDHLDDEILSALLDGDAGHRDAEAHVLACDRCAGRQAELAAARAALAAAPVDVVDELTRRRLVAAALQAADAEPTSTGAALPARARSRWAARHPAFVGSAAAVVLALLVGVPFVVGNDKSRDADSTLAAGAPEGAELASPFLGDLGDLSDRENLRLRLTSRRSGDPFGYAAPMEPGASPAAGAPTAAPAVSPVPGAGGLASTTTLDQTSAPMAARGGGSGSAEKATAGVAADASTSNAAQGSDEAARDRADTDACVAALLSGPAQGGRLTASGTGTFEGRPAIVAVFDLSGGGVAFVADRSGCVVRDRFAV